MRSFLAALAGIVSAGVAIWLFEFLGHLLFPIGDLNIDPTDMDAIKQIMFQIPTGALVAVILAHALGLFVGLIVARIIDKSSLAALFGVAGIITLMTLINLLIIPHPTWFLIADLAGVLIVATWFIASRKKT